VRIVALFSVIAALPTLLLAVAATTTFSRSLDGWFSTKTRTIVDTSMEVAKAYFDEHGLLINNEILNMARDLDASAQTAKASSEPFTNDDLRNLLLSQTVLRGLELAFIIDAQGQVVVSALDNNPQEFQRPPIDAIAKAEAGQVPLLDSRSTLRVYAIAKLAQYPRQYLYVARPVSPTVVAQMRRTEQNAAEYNRLRSASRNLKLAHGLMYFMISIEAALEVSRGNLAVALPEKRGEGDLRRLSMTFNTMTRELKTQRDELMAVNTQLVDRRRFMEAVLSGVSAGVIGLDRNGTITLISRSAETLLGVTARNLVGQKLSLAIPEFAELLTRPDESGLKQKTQDQISILVGANERTFAVQVTRERAGEADVGTVVTLDDVTDLVVAQRTSAWADVARRIAHEIKNPLTPIQLSAERIKRKYGPMITSDKETFDKLADTISRQVGDIKSMVDEFASFARMPQPQMESADLRQAVQESVVLFRETHPAIRFDLAIPPTTVAAMIDRRLITQAMTNLVKNATEAIEARSQHADKPDDWRGWIETRVVRLADRVVIDVIDNGIGLPKQNRAKLLEPYVTTRAKGTGLGLAIVQKIIEQHRGTLVLEDAPITAGRDRGAMVRVTLPMPLKEGAPVTLPEEGIVSTSNVSAAIKGEPALSKAASMQDFVASPPSAVAATESQSVPETISNVGNDVGHPTAVHAPNPASDVDATPVSPSPATAAAVSPRLLKNSDRVMPKPPSRSQGAR
jgi:two-component system, NtrC family, nitrogen regulation sensor histidine kinase NtrY